jgi:transcription antitermination factor NusG
MPAFWGVVRSNPQRERFAWERVEALGYPVFLPMVATKQGGAPLWRGYFFARIETRWRPISTCFGVLCLVRVGDFPSKMPDAEIERLRSMMVGGYVQLPDFPSKPGRHVFKRNERVTITGGPFQGVRALHSGLSAAEKEFLLLKLLGATRRVAVPSSMVASAQ